jgi:serine/threonine protein kinase
MPPATFPAHFLRIAKAGSGASGGVYFCVPVSRVQSLTNVSTLTPSSPDFPSLKASLVAVKVSSNHWWIENEYAALQEIRQCRSPDAEALRAFFPEVMDMGVFTPPGHVLRHAYLELEAVEPPITLGDLMSFYGDPKNNTPAIPIPLVYHFFLSLGAAVLFLRDEVGWAQDDIKPDNILVRMYHGAPFALPQFVLIDFGNAKRVAETQNDVSSDYMDVMGLVRMMVRMAEWDTGEHWAAFKEILFADKARIRESGEDRKLADERFRGLWERWEGVAKKGRKDVTVREVEGIREVFEKVAMKKGGVRDEDLIGAARWYGKTGGGI